MRKVVLLLDLLAWGLFSILGLEGVYEWAASTAEPVRSEYLYAHGIHYILVPLGFLAITIVAAKGRTGWREIVSQVALLIALFAFLPFFVTYTGGM